MKTLNVLTLRERWKDLVLLTLWEGSKTRLGSLSVARTRHPKLGSVAFQFPEKWTDNTSGAGLLLVLVSFRQVFISLYWTLVVLRKVSTRFMYSKYFSVWYRAWDVALFQPNLESKKGQPRPPVPSEVGVRKGVYAYMPLYVHISSLRFAMLSNAFLVCSYVLRISSYMLIYIYIYIYI